MKKHHNMLNTPLELETMVQLLQVCSDSLPEKTAVYVSGNLNARQREITCHSLNHDAKKLAALMQTIAGKGEKVLLLYPAGGQAAITGFFATWYAGMTAVPCNIQAPLKNPDYLRKILNEVRPTLLLSSHEYYAEIENMLAQEPAFQSTWVLLTDTLSEHNVKWCEPEITSDSPALLLCETSGETISTVTFNHSQLLQDTAKLTMTPLPHTAGPQDLIMELLQAIYQCKRVLRQIPVEPLLHPHEDVA